MLTTLADPAFRTYNDKTAPVTHHTLTILCLARPRTDVLFIRGNLFGLSNHSVVSGQMQSATQQAANFVELHTSSQDHSVCDGTKWVEGIVTVPSGQDAQLSLVHPNALGRRNAADLVEDAMLNVIDVS